MPQLRLFFSTLALIGLVMGCSATPPVAMDTTSEVAQTSMISTQTDSDPQRLSAISPVSLSQDRSTIDGGDIESIDGDITYLDVPPVSVELGEFESDVDLFIFPEKKNHRLTRDLAVDLAQPGDYFPDTFSEDQRTWESLNPGFIPAGTRVDSYYLHFDNETYNDTFNLRDYVSCVGQYQVSGRITFSNPVLGIAMRAGYGKDASLRRSDTELGLPEIEYCDHYFRHFPGVNIVDGCQSDRFILSEDRRTLWVTNNTDIHHDNYRVIVAADGNNCIICG